MKRQREEGEESNPRRVRTSHAPILPPQRSNNRSTVELDRVYRNNMIYTITLRPIRRAGDRYSNVAILSRYAIQLRTEIYRSLRQNYSDQQIRRRVRLSLFMHNWNNEGNTNVENGLNIQELNGQTMVSMFEEATANGSNADIDIYDVIWKVWINPASLNSSGSTLTEAKEQGLYQFNWKLKPFEIAGVKVDVNKYGCAAKVLALGMEKKENQFEKNLPRSKDFTRSVHNLQRDLRFEDPRDVTVLELSKFVDLHPTYRIAICSSVKLQADIYQGLIILI